MTTTLMFAPLTDSEVYDRQDQAAARYGQQVMFRKFLVPDRDAVMDRSARATTFRAKHVAELENTCVVWNAAGEQRLFQGRLDDWARALQRLEVGAVKA